MRFRWYILPAVLGISIFFGSAAFAASATEYTAARGQLTVTNLGSTDQLTSQFPGHSGQVIEVDGTVNGMFTSDGHTGFLLQVDPSQTLIFTMRQEDQDIAIANKVRVLARIPQEGTVLDVISVERLSLIGQAMPGTPTPPATGKLPLPASAPVAPSQPIVYYQGASNTDTAPSSAGGTGMAQQPAVVQRYALKIKEYNGHIADDMATKIAATILEKSERYNVDPRLVMALVAQESRFNPYAVSHTGAMGLGQLMPSTASVLGVHDAFDISDNLDGSVRYLREQLQTFGRVSLALAAYNAGPNSVKRYGGVPPYHETQNYVQVIWQNYTNISTEIVD